MSPHPDQHLSDYLDGTLDPALQRDVADHLAGCADCRTLLADLAAIQRTARGLASVPVEPATDLWPRIAARLQGPREAVPAVGRAATGPPAQRPRVAWYRRRVTIGVPELALAASLAAAVGGAILWPRPPASAPAVQEAAPVLAQAEALDADPGMVTPASFADAQYDAAVNDLERVLREQRDRLDPRTVIVLERNLRVIDDAIAEARQALSADPANALLNAHLAGARQRKLDLLRRAALITEGD
jgi:anti-sigma factor RsiW